MEGQPSAIEVAGLCKDYGRVHAVEGVSFRVRRGEIYALLGPNGAGKTTIVEILEGHRKRTSGSVRVLGFDPGTGGRRFRERVGIVLQSGGIDAELTVREIVALYASFYARPRAGGGDHRAGRPERQAPGEGADAVGRAAAPA